MSLNRLTRERLFKDEELFNKLLPYAAYDESTGLFWHSDTSIWAMLELKPLLMLSISDSQAFQISSQFQELLDSLEHNIAVQVNWITTFDVEDLLERSLRDYPTSGPAGWMAKRWIRSMRGAAKSSSYSRRPRKLRLLLSFRFNPPWLQGGFVEDIMRSIRLLFGSKELGGSGKKQELERYALEFNGLIDGKCAKLADLGFAPRRLNAQDLIDLMYPLLNRRSIKAGKFRRSKSTSVAVPTWDKNELLLNQVSDTAVEHPENGYIIKDGRVFRSVSMVKPPKSMLPLMIAPLQSSPYENILTVTFSKDELDKQLARLDRLDSTLGFREFTARGRGNQKIQHQISSVRTARKELYNSASQLVRVGLHQTFITQTKEEAYRSASEAVATFPQLAGARGMVHTITDLAVMINSLPGCYDPTTDGPGWTNIMRSSRAARLFPLFGNWQGSNGSNIVLPSLWNRELVGMDLFDSNVAPNVLISGVSGAGKSYLLCFLIITLNRGHYSRTPSGKLLERRPITFIFDKGMAGQPCGFEKVAKLFGGRIYEASPSRAPAMNFLARLGVTEPQGLDEDYKDLIDICSDIVCSMASEGDKSLDRLDRGAVIEALVESHRIYRSGPMKREFILSDIISVLRAPKRIDENDEQAHRRQRIALLTADYHGDGTYARFFDRPGALVLKERFIVFDLKALSRNPDLQRVFLKVAMLWADTVMNDPNELDTRKVLVFDEAHDLIGKTSAGTIETAFRLYRKRKGIVIAASQSGEDFYIGEGGQSIVQNSAHKIFLRQDPNKFHFTAQAFNLSDQQADVILRLKTIKGIESQFYFISDIGEAALCLPLEPAFYWASTNNGDDNQFFADVLNHTGNEFWQAFEYAVALAPRGAAYLRRSEQGDFEEEEGEKSVTNVVNSMIGNAIDRNK
jgi:hypothetical protein